MQSSIRRFRGMPVEKILCPILLISGGDDRIWPSEVYAEQIKLRCAHGAAKCIHLNYPNAGHQIGMPYLPAPAPVYTYLDNRWYSLGGNAKENELAKRDAWLKTIQFLKNSFSSRL